MRTTSTKSFSELDDPLLDSLLDATVQEPRCAPDLSTEHDRRLAAAIWFQATGEPRSAVWQEGSIDMRPEELELELVPVHAFLELLEVHFAGWLPGLAPTAATLRRMFDRDLVFGAYHRRKQGRHLIAAVHARIVSPSQSIGAHAIAEASTEPGAFGLSPSPVTATERSVVCYAAVTHRAYQRCGIAHRLITGSVLPYLSQSPDTRDCPWITSSPFTDIVPVGRQLSLSPDFPELLNLCERRLRKTTPLGCSSLRELISLASPYLEAEQFELQISQEEARDPARFFMGLYAGLLTHTELLALRQGTPLEQGRAQAFAQRIHRLNAAYEQNAEHLRIGQEASWQLLYLAAALVQSGVYSARTGRPVDPVMSLHFSNGARLNTSWRLLPLSRPQDLAALLFGQSVAYGPDWQDQMHRNLLRSSRRREICQAHSFDGIRVDLEEAEHLHAA